MKAHPLSRLDFRPYANQRVIIGQIRTEPMPSFHKQRFYILGAFNAELPAHVKAIVEDDAHEYSETLFVVQVNGDGDVEGAMCPLIVFDDAGMLRYGQDMLAGVIEAGKRNPDIAVEMAVVRGVHFEEGA
jgi:hypothetical protein